MDVDKNILIEYLYDNVNRDNYTLNDTSHSLYIEIEGFKFIITVSSIIYTKNGVQEIIHYTAAELDDLNDKVRSFYTKEDLNSELHQEIRSKRVENILR